MIVLYDGACGFCRWAMAWALRLEGDQHLRPAAIQSRTGDELLADLAPAERLRAVHVVDPDGVRRSGGSAVVQVLATLRTTRWLARLGLLSPRATERVYLLVADYRGVFGRFVGTRARERADRLLDVDQHRRA